MCVCIRRSQIQRTDIFTALSVQFPLSSPFGSKRAERTDTITAV